MSPTATSLRFFKHAESIAKIDSDLQELENRARQLRAKRNQLVPVGEVPAEILTRIFGFVLVDNEKITTADILPITWVSQDWRNVAISCPTLWSHIDGSCYSWVDECLGRSGGHHLSVSIISTKTRDEVVLKRTLDEAFPRIASLAVLSPRRLGGRRALPFSGEQPAPHFLHSLTLAGHDVPQNLFPGPITQIRHLALFDCRFKCKMFHRFTGLTHLTIRRPTVAVSLSDILGLLSVTPLLQEIVLTKIFGRSDVIRSGTALPSPSLPNLISLELKEKYTQIIQLLQYIAIPDPVNLRIHIHLGKIAASDLSSLLSVANHRFSASRPVRALAIKVGRPDTISLHFYSSPSWNENEGCLKIGIDVQTITLCSSSDSWFAAALRDLPLDSVQTLYLESPHAALPPNICDSALFLLNNVKDLHVEGYFVNKFTEYLVAHTSTDVENFQETSGSKSSQNTVFPAMEKLILGDWYFVPQELLLSKLADAIAVRRKSQLKEVIARRKPKYWEPVAGQMVDVVVENAAAPCVFEKFEADEDYPVSDSDSD